MDANTKKMKATKRKSHVSSDEEDFLTISEEEVEFLDQGVVQKPKNLLLVCTGRLLFKHFGYQARLLFKYFGCEARLLFKKIWVQSKTFV